MTKLILLSALALVLIPATAVAQDNYYLGNNDTECTPCHTLTIATWQLTGHSTAFDDLAPLPFFGFSCLECHTTGWDTDVVNYGPDEYVQEEASNGYSITDQVNWDRVANVQCEACHGPVGTVDRDLVGFNEHQADAVVDYSADNCGRCHQGSHHPTFEDWQLSKHAVAKVTPRNLVFIPSSPSCAGCHTTEGFIQWAAQDQLEPDVEPPGLDGSDITCSGCHNPHGTSNPGNLRLPPDELCQKCHNPEFSPDNPTPEPGQTLHHTTAFMLAGEGGFEFAGFNYSSSAHTTVVANDCTACHVFMIPFDEGPPEIPAFTGHTFEPRGEACVECHADFVPKETNFDYRGIQTEIAGLVDQLEALLERADSSDSTTAEFLQAQFNLQFVESDGSHGIHNTAYARALLQSSLQILTPVPAAALTAVTVQREDVGVVIGWQADGVLSGFTVLVYREGEGNARVRVSDDPLSATTTTEWVDRTATQEELSYWFELIAPSGDSTWQGPYLVAAMNTAVGFRSVGQNPFRSEALLGYGVPKPGNVHITVHDLRGRLVRTLVTTYQAAGTYTVAWNGRDDLGRTMASGVYYARFDHGGAYRTLKLVLAH